MPKLCMMDSLGTPCTGEQTETLRQRKSRLIVATSVETRKSYRTFKDDCQTKSMMFMILLYNRSYLNLSQRYNLLITRMRHTKMVATRVCKRGQKLLKFENEKTCKGRLMDL
jgi:hypothetical protein